MNAAKLIKLAPMLMLVAFLAYSGYSIHASAEDPAADPSGLVKDTNTVVQDIPKSGNAIEGGLAAALRDPFQVSLKPGAATGASQSQDDPSFDSDLVVKIVEGLKLDATFLQGRDEMAIINGRVYSNGHYLIIDANSGKSSPKLLVVRVLPAKVILRGGDKDYVLSYPDQLVLSQKSRNSPVAARTKSMNGKSAGPVSHAGFAPPSRRSRGSRTGNP